MVSFFNKHKHSSLLYPNKQAAILQYQCGQCFPWPHNYHQVFQRLQTLSHLNLCPPTFSRLKTRVLTPSCVLSSFLLPPTRPGAHHPGEPVWHLLLPNHPGGATCVQGCGLRGCGSPPSPAPSPGPSSCVPSKPQAPPFPFTPLIPMKKPMPLGTAGPCGPCD